MRESLLLQFPVSEYQDRLGRLVSQMADHELDAIVFTSDDNTYYFSGFQSIVWDSKVSTPCVLTITADGEMRIATSKSGVETAKATSCVEDIVWYDRRGSSTGGYPTFAKAICSLLQEKGLVSGRIGLELGAGTKMHLAHEHRERLFAELSDAQVKDCSDAVWAVRSVKSTREIQVLRESCRINHEGIAAGFAAVHEGMSELELYRTIAIEYFQGGAERSLLLGVRAGKERYSQGNSPPSRRPIGRGEIILVDGGPIYKGYYSDIIREGVIGKPSPRQLDMFAVAREACYVGIDAMKPGVRLGDVCDAVDAFLEESQYAEYSVTTGWCGHSIGTGVHEFPMLESGCNTLLEPGMVFAVEPYFFKDGIGSLGIEENVLVTDTGTENLTPSTSELLIVG
jgi:Xaa-Pro aminopeptidase